MSEKPEGAGRKELYFIGFVFLAVIGVIIAYVLKFYGRSLGEPEQWGQLGDFVGGLVNPAIGLATIVFVWRTLLQTRVDAAAAKAESKRTERLADMHRRLDSLLHAWHSHVRETKLVRFINGLPENYTIGELLTSADRLREAHQSFSDPNKRLQINVGHGEVIKFLLEFASYCAAYDKLSDSKVLGDFYRRRVETAAKLFAESQGIDAATISALLVEPAVIE